MRRINNIHLVGIGGSGIGGIAEVLLNLGYKVTGSDVVKSHATEHLKNLGIDITYSHIAENVAYCDVVVASTAIMENNIELITARKRRIPIVPRAQMLAELMRFKYGIAVAGSHGKTTTTSLVATILAEAGKDPTYVIGGKLNSASTNAKLGSGDLFVAEADESDSSFLYLSPMIAVVTGIDNDHLNNYEYSLEKLTKAFLDFIHKLPFYGLAIVCLDDPQVRSIISKISRPTLSYGFSNKADVRAINWRQSEGVSYFQIVYPGVDKPVNVCLNMPGKHNTLDALAAYAIAKEIGVDDKIIYKALSKFQGINRRFQIADNILLPNNKGKILLIDDYGHHPCEIKSVLDTVYQGWHNRRVIMVFQPHRYTRLKALFFDFVDILSKVENLFLLDVYSAGENYVEELDSTNLCSNIMARKTCNVSYIANVEELFTKLEATLKDNDILILQGAGDIGKISGQLLRRFNETLNRSETTVGVVD